MASHAAGRVGGAVLRCRRWATTGRSVASTVGVRGVLVLGIERLVPRRLLHVEWFVVTELLTTTRRPMPPEGDVRWATPGDDALLASAGGDPALVRRRREAGDAAAVCVRDGRLAGYVYLRSGTYDEQGMIIRLREGERWIYDGAVVPELRGAGVYPHLVRAVAEDLAASGVDRLLSAIDRINTASLRSARRRGTRAIGAVAMLRILGVSFRREDWFGEIRYRVYRGRRDLVTPPVEASRRRPVPVGRGG